MNVEIAPQTEVVSFETVARKGLPGARWVVEWHPQAHLALAVYRSIYGIIALFCANTLSWLYA